MPDEKKTAIRMKLDALRAECIAHTDAAKKLNEKIRLLEQVEANPEAHKDLLEALKG